MQYRKKQWEITLIFLIYCRKRGIQFWTKITININNHLTAVQIPMRVTYLSFNNKNCFAQLGRGIESCTGIFASNYSTH